MGKGDIKTRRGKIINSSYGKHRMRKKTVAYKAPIEVVKPKEEEVPVVVEEVAPKKAAVKKTTAAKKTTAKKPAAAKKTTATKKTTTKKTATKKAEK